MELFLQTLRRGELESVDGRFKEGLADSVEQLTTNFQNVFVLKLDSANRISSATERDNHPARVRTSTCMVVVTTWQLRSPQKSGDRARCLSQSGCTADAAGFWGGRDCSKTLTLRAGVACDLTLICTADHA